MPDRRAVSRAAALAAMLACGMPAPRAETVYRWMDDDGTLHLSNQKPPAGITAEKFYIRDGPRPPQPAAQRGSTPARAQVAKASPAQQAARSDALRALQDRQCVIAREGLEALGEDAEPAERRRLQQLANQNCR